MAEVILFPKKQFTKKISDFRKDIVFWVGLYITMLFRYFYFGIQYFPFTEDNSRYGIYYRNSANIWNNIVLANLNYKTHPFALLMDAYFTMRFWRQLWIMIVLFTTMHFLSCYLLNQIFKKSGMKFGVFGVIVFALTPTLYEAAYWISASSHIVVGMFLTVLSVYMLIIFIEKFQNEAESAPRFLTAFWLFNLLSVGFHEQVSVFSFVFSILILIVHHKKVPLFSRICVFVVPILNIIIISSYYYFMKFTNIYTDLQTELLSYGLVEHAAETTKRIANLLCIEQFQIGIYTLTRGISLLTTLKDAISIVVLIAFSVFLFYRLLNKSINIEKNTENGWIYRIAFGIILTIAPFSIFYVSQNTYLETHSIFTSFVGISLLLDTAIDGIAHININFNGKKRHLTAIKAVIAPICIVPFFIMTVSIIDSYRVKYDTDSLIAQNFITAFENSSYELKNYPEQKGRIVIFNTKSTYDNIELPVMNNCIADSHIFQGKINSLQSKYMFENIALVENEKRFDSSWSTEHPIFGIDESGNIFELVEKSGQLLITQTREQFGYINDGFFYRFIK